MISCGPMCKGCCGQGGCAISAEAGGAHIVRDCTMSCARGAVDKGGGVAWYHLRAGMVDQAGGCAISCAWGAVDKGGCAISSARGGGGPGGGLRDIVVKGCCGQAWGARNRQRGGRGPGTARYYVQGVSGGPGRGLRILCARQMMEHRVKGGAVDKGGCAISSAPGGGLAGAGEKRAG